MKSILINIKKTKFFYLFLWYFFIPIYNFIWEYVINFIGKLYYYYYQIINSKNKNKIKIKVPKVIQKDTDIVQIANYLKKYILDNELEKKYIKIIKSDEYKNKKMVYNLASAQEPYKYNFFMKLIITLNKKF